MKSLRIFLRWRNTVLDGRRQVGLIERNNSWHLVTQRRAGEGWAYIPVPPRIQISRIVKALNGGDR